MTDTLNNDKSGVERREGKKMIQNTCASTKESKYGLDFQCIKYVASLKIHPLQDLAFQDFDRLVKKQEAKKGLATRDINTCDDSIPSDHDKASTNLNPDDKSYVYKTRRNSLFRSMEPRVFALEYNNEGKRRYLVAHLGRFMHHYWVECNPSNRHFYELIKEKTPCRLYFDIEYNKKANPTITPDTNETLMDEFIAELIGEIQTVYDVSIDRTNIVDLDSSTSKKFSRHLIVHFPGGELFADAVSCGVFVKSFVGRLAEEEATGVLRDKRPVLARYLFLYAKEDDGHITNENGSGKDDKDAINNMRAKTCFIDTGVYTRNRIFRILGSMKYGKASSAALRIADANEFSFPKGFSNDDFYQTCSPAEDEDKNGDTEEQTKDWEGCAKSLADTFVVPIEVYDRRLDCKILRQLKEDESHKGTAICTKGIKPSSRKPSRVETKYGSTPFYALDKFVNHTLALRHGLNGSVRSWSIDTTTCEGSDLSRCFITYQMKDNRWCENIQRCHKSNNIMWIVSIGDMTYWQACHDPDCRMASFRGRTRDLPQDVIKEISDALLERANHVNESFEQALLNLDLEGCDKVGRSVDQQHDHYVYDDQIDEEFERALLNLDLGDGDEQQREEIQKDCSPCNKSGTHSFGVDEEFERALLNLDLGDGDEQQKKEIQKDSSSCDKSGTDIFDVDEDFERALLALNLDDIVREEKSTS